MGHAAGSKGTERRGNAAIRTRARERVTGILLAERRAGHAGLGREVTQGQPGGAEDTFLLQDVIAVVLIDHPVDRLEVELVEECGPAAIEPGHAGDQVARDRAAAAGRGRLEGPGRGCVPATERPERGDRRGEGPARSSGPVATPAHWRRRRRTISSKCVALAPATRVQPRQRILEVLAPPHERRGRRTGRAAP